MKKALSLFVIASALVTGCAQQVAQVAPAQNAQTEPVATTQEAPVQKKINLEIGKKYGAMTLAKLENNNATFTGTVEVQGTYYTSDLNGNICMTLDEGSQKKLPNLTSLMGLSSRTEVCFSNKEQARKALNPLGSGSNEIAKVTIEGYSDQAIDSSLQAMTKFVKLISKTSTK